MTQPAQSPAGVIHSLQYKRYEGARLGAATRFMVIARYALMMQWRQTVVKLSMLAGLMALGIGGVVVGFKWGLSSMAERAGGAAGRGLIAAADSIAVTDAMTAQWIPSIVMVLVCGSPAIASDLRAGAFQFHFARPVSAAQYLAGRMLSATAWAALFSYATLGAYCLELIAFRHDPAVAAKCLGLGAVVVTVRLATLGAVALGCSSLTRRAGLAQAMFLAVLVGSGLATNLAARLLHRGWLEGLSVLDSTEVLARTMFGDSHLHGVALAAAPAAALAWALGFLAVAWARVSRAEVVRG